MTTNIPLLRTPAGQGFHTHQVPLHLYFYQDTISKRIAKAKEDPSLNEIRLLPAGHQPSIF